VRVLRYGRELGYAHALLAAIGAGLAVRAARGGRATGLERLSLELLVAPLPWYVVFRQHVAIHDFEVLFFAPGVACAATVAIESLARRGRGAARVVVAAALLVATGAGVALALERRDVWTEPRELGEAIRDRTRFEEPAATSSIEHSIIWTSDRYVHLDVRDEAALDALLAARDGAAPVAFALPRREADGELGRALARRFAAEANGDVLVFDLRRAPRGR
jgi:hypothetical protein